MKNIGTRTQDHFIDSPTTPFLVLDTEGFAVGLILCSAFPKSMARNDEKLASELVLLDSQLYHLPQLCSPFSVSAITIEVYYFSALPKVVAHLKR